MALTEQVQLDIQNAQRQIDQLETELAQLGRPIDVPVDIDSSGVQEVARHLRDAEGGAEGLTADLNLARAASGNLQADVAQLASALGISEAEATELVQEFAQARVNANQLETATRNVAQSLGLSSDDAAAMEREIRSASGAIAEAEAPSRALASGIGEAQSASEGLQVVWSRIRPLIATAAAALGARAVLGAGWERFTTIEDSTRALTVQLQSADEAASLLGETLEVVRGTPFNLDQFAAATSQLISFGVEADRIPGILTAIGEAAATRGARAPEFVERLVALFGQITTTGRISGEELRRFGETGVNALAILANTMGVTADEMRTMVSEGLVPADEAIRAITAGIVEGTDGAAGATVALGGTMEGLRSTLSGAGGGLNAAVARFGAELVEIASPAILSWLQAATLGFDSLGQAIGGAGAEAESNGVIDFISDLPRGFGAVADIVGGAAGALFNFSQGMAFLSTGGAIGSLEGFADAFGSLGSAIDSTDIRVIEQDIIPFLRSGGSEIDAFANAIDRLNRKGLLDAATVDRFVTLTGVDLAGQIAVLDAFATSGTLAGDAVDEIVAALIDLQNEARGGDIESIRLRNLTAGLPQAGADIQALRDRVRELNAETVEIDFESAIGELEQQFDRLPDALDAAGAALRTEENEIVTDFSDFMDNLEGEISARRAFRDNIELLRALGLDNLADVFTDAGLDSAQALADGLTDPATLQAAENQLVADMRDAAAAAREAIADVMLQPLDLTIPVNATLAVQDLIVSGFDPSQALAEVVARGGRPDAPVVNVDQTFSGFTPSSTDLARATQSINSIVATVN